MANGTGENGASTTAETACKTVVEPTAADRRPRGGPKATVRDAFRAALTGSLVRFGLGAGLSLSISLGGTALLVEGLGVPPAWAFPLSLVAATAVNFLFTRFFVFRGTVVPWKSQLVTYLASSVLFRGAEYAGFLVLLRAAGAPYPVAIIAAQVVSFVAKFLFYRAVVFARPPAKDPAPPPDRRRL